MPPHPPVAGAAELAARLEKLGLSLGEREASHQVGLREARSCLEGLRGSVAAALERFREAVVAAGAPQLRVALSEVRVDDKHLRAVQFDLTRGRYRRSSPPGPAARSHWSDRFTLARPRDPVSASRLAQAMT